MIKTTLAIDISAVDLNKLLYDEYVTADNHLLKSHLREIISFEKLPDEVVFYSEVLYLDERLYTFNQNINFDEFKARYDFGQES